MKLLAKTHLFYLLFLPMVGFACLIYEGFVLTFWIAFCFGWIPMIVYVSFLLQKYELSRRPRRALVLVGAVPLQIGVVTWLLGDSVSFFFIEATFVELFGLSVALALAMLLYRPSGWLGAIVGVLLAVAAGAAFGPPLITHYLEMERFWWGILAVAVGTGIWTNLQFVLPAASFGASPGSGRAPFIVRATDFVLGPPGQTERPGAKWNTFVTILVVLGAWFVVGIFAVMAQVVAGKVALIH